MTAIHISIVGVGPRGLSILERLSHGARQRARAQNFVIHLVDPGEPGEGAHPAGQLRCLVTNTLASQVTIFPLRDPADPDRGQSGPSFTDWARAAGYRRFGTEFLPGGPEEGEAITDDDYLPRAHLGEYLSHAYRTILADLPEGVSVIHHRTNAVDIRHRGGDGFLVWLEGGGSIDSDYVFLTTGHCRSRLTERDHHLLDFVARNSDRNPRLGYVRHVYPVDRLSSVRPDATVAVQGLGLTAYDVIAGLTVGRGGRFEPEEDGRLRYVASGGEPRIRLFSRNSLPYAARGKNQKGIADRDPVHFFTREAIEERRHAAAAARGSRQLDFEGDVLPLLKTEMAYRFRSTLLGREAEVAGFEPTAQERAIIDSIIDPLAHQRHESFADFRSALLDHVATDLAEANKGNRTSPWKAATDIIRDTRDSTAAAVEHEGLTPDSHRIFIERYIPIMNRISFGPPRFRNAEFLALVDAGILDWAGGPGSSVDVDEDGARFVVTTRFPTETVTTPADVLVIARLDFPIPEEDESPLIANLLLEGLARPYRNGGYHPCGLAIDQNHRLITADGEPQGRIWAIGYPVEGKRFYTHALPRPFRQSVHLKDAADVVADFFRNIEASLDSAPWERVPDSALVS